MDDMTTTLPHDENSEKVVLACCMTERFSREKIAEALDIGITPDVFFVQAHKHIFRAIAEAYESEMALSKK